MIENKEKNEIKIVDISKWHKMLNWKESPNFQTCHRHDNVNDFDKEYCKSEEIENLIKNIFVLFNTPGSSNAQLMGKMGAGKTTFLHYLKRNLISNRISENIFFTIVRTGRIALDNHEKSLKTIFIDHVFKKFFKYTGHEEEYKRIIENCLDTSLCLLKLQNYYFDNDNKFNRSLVVVLDDMDTLENEEDVAKITNSFKRICGSGDKINKWVSLRENTYSHYSEELKNKFTFFQQPYTLPKVSLFEIVQKRIMAKNDNDDVKNPFSEELCNVLMKFNNESIRDSLGMFPMILENTKVPERNQSASFIQNWMKYGAITTLLKRGLIRNIHTDDFIVIYNYPLAFDLLNVIKYIKIKNQIFTTVYKIANEVRGNLINEAYHLVEEQLEMALNILIKNGLVTIDTDTERITLSSVGDIIISFRPEKYNEICKELSEDNQEDIDSEYWDILFQNVPYKQYAKSRHSTRKV